MALHPSLFLALALAATPAAAMAEPRPLPGADLMAPGSTAVGTPDYGSSVKPASDTATPSPDRNGDGYVELSELAPDSQLAKRFATRDHDRDGKLSREEYYFK